MSHEVRYTRKNPYRSQLTARRRITAGGSSKEVWHISLTVDWDELKVQPGDSVGVLAPPPAALVNAILAAIDHDEASTPEFKDELAAELFSRHEVSIPSPKLARLAGTGLNPTQDLPVPDVLDLLTCATDRIPASRLRTLLRPAMPRAFSVASFPDEPQSTLDLTVARLTRSHEGRVRHGIASDYLITAPLGSQVALVPVPHPEFRLPQSSQPVILIAAGTGIAPMRGFLQQRALLPPAPTWLIFGDRNRATDFLYQDELDQARRNGVLDRLDTAFSRDLDGPRYVQEVLAQEEDEICQWLADGATVYICGHSAMVTDTQAAIAPLFEQAGITPESGQDLLEYLRNSGRLNIDLFD